MSNNIEDVHPDYLANCADWEFMRNLVNNRYRQYVLPVEFWPGYPAPCKDSKIKARNDKYVELARYCNFTLSTKNGLLGTALGKKYTCSLPTQISYLEKEATGNKLNLEQLARKIIGELLEVSRCGLFVDMPTVSIDMTGAETKIVNPRAKMYVYETENIRNWDLTEVSGSEELGFLVLRELTRTRKDRYSWCEEFMYRILSLEDGGLYTAELRDKYDVIQGEPSTPMAKKKRLDKIPFFIAGSDDNDWCVDKPVLWPIAHVSVGHLRNSASYEDNLDAHGQGTLAVTSSLNNTEWKKANGNKTLKLGSREGYFLGTQGSMTLCQLAANQESANAMIMKQDQLVMMGADIIMPASANSPVETTKLHMGSKLSKLDNVVSNAEDLIRNGLKACAVYMGADPEDVEFNLSHSFVQEIADANMARELAAWWVQRIIPKKIVRDYGKKVNLIGDDVSDEEMDEQIRQEDMESGAGIGGFSENTHSHDSGAVTRTNDSQVDTSE